MQLHRGRHGGRLVASKRGISLATGAQELRTAFKLWRTDKMADRCPLSTGWAAITEALRINTRQALISVGYCVSMVEELSPEQQTHVAASATSTINGATLECELLARPCRLRCPALCTPP